MFRKRVNETDSAGETTNKVKKPRKAMSKKKKRRIIVGTIAILVIAAIVIVPKLMGGEPPALMVTTGSAEKMDLQQAVSIKGTIQGSEKADVATSLNSEILSILVEEGDIVHKDQVLAVLDSKDLEDDYQKAQTALNQSKFNYEAAKSLYEEGAISKEDFVKAENTYKSDQITVNSYNISDKVNIKSPIAGTVTRVNVNIGRYANDTENKEPMFVVEDLQNLEMNVRISEFDISKIKVGQKVEITSEVLGNQAVDGVVSRISPTGELKDQSSKEMVIPVEIDVNKGNTNLIAGVTAKATIEIETRSNVLTVPIDALLEDPNTGDNYVMVLDGTKLKKIAVELGLEGDFNVEIASGELSEGDKVVLNPTFDMTDGMDVTPAPEV
ncbi:efflux RND transporter periplasmic adaptor subunit [Anoxybacterium hadale]|uniref:Efflux RND transporter periplasmic adaptor subunit n=1 Tax=Anoxybacterium hadale TaxID=3408580 RepID=A0ACD1AAY4_9FIRM|nr:efflux RND transporter periplasmic adaptor subunit [Clostridiales bacterium]